MARWCLAWVSLALIGVAITAGKLPAQEREPLRQPASIPVDLAVALATSGGFGVSGDPQILVGELPEWVSGRVAVPQGARIVGSAFLGSVVVGVLSATAPSDSMMLQLESDMKRRGWTSPPIQYTGGGFRPAATLSSGRVSRSILCREGQYFTAWISRQQATSATVMFRLMSTPPSGTGGPCSRPTQSGAMRGSPYPTLYNPEGAEAYGPSRNCHQLGGSSGTMTNLNTPMSPQDILGHYGKQIQDSGWAPAITVPPISGLVWTRKDSAGVTRQLWLTVISSPTDANCRAVRLDVSETRGQ